ncbi:MAG: Hsp70 family protein [Blautia sp.]
MYGDADVQIFDVLPQSIGILSGDKILPMIKRNSQIPTTAQKYFKTIEDNQQYVRIRIFQGNSVIPEECTELGEMLIDGLEPRPAGETLVAAVLNVNSDCILHCKSAVDNKLKEITLNLNTSDTAAKPAEDKNVIRWRRHAAKMDPVAAKELLAMLDGYGTKYSKEDIANFILANKQHKEYDTKKVTEN